MVKERYIPIIKETADIVRNKNGMKKSAVIGDYIFTILQQECVVVMRPNEKQPDLDGFSTEKVIQGNLKTVVYINTAKNVEKQNFCAAHELGHCYGIERLILDSFPHDVIQPSEIEEIMNRFAAELMMPEKDFWTRGVRVWKSSGTYGRNKAFQITVKRAIQVIIELMDFYYMPYKAVLYRMEEVKIISPAIRDFLEKFENNNRSVVDQMIADMGITRLRTPDYKVQTSPAVRKEKAVLENARITKYLTEPELKNYLKNLGLSEDNIALAGEMRKLETEMLDLTQQ